MQLDPELELYAMPQRDLVRSDDNPNPSPKPNP